MCQHNSFLIFHSMGEKSLPRWRIVTLITTSTAFTFAMAYALTGYVVFGQKTEGRGALADQTALFSTKS